MMSEPQESNAAEKPQEGDAPEQSQLKEGEATEKSQDSDAPEQLQQKEGEATEKSQEGDATEEPQQKEGEVAENSQEGDAPEEPQQKGDVAEKPQEGEATQELQAQESDVPGEPQSQGDISEKPKEAEAPEKPQEDDAPEKPQEGDAVKQPQEGEATEKAQEVAAQKEAQESDAPGDVPAKEAADADQEGDDEQSADEAETKPKRKKRKKKRQSDTEHPGEQSSDEEWDSEETETESQPSEDLNPEHFICPPYRSKKCTIIDNFFEFYHSFGYDCQRHFNLVLMEEKILIFASGNYIHFYNTETKELSFRRSAFGGGIGHIVKNPNPEYPQLAVAENGEAPIIIVYIWPNFEIECVLREGAQKTYTCLCYSSDGLLLCSQAGEPDYMLTIWKWKEKKIMLRQQSHVQTVFNVNFSSYAPNHLTTCGSAHIKFWKIATTFTGVKLLGQLGKFGKTEVSDVIGCFALPNEKVVSGVSWGNILVWDEGLISLEVTQKQRKNCHSAAITQFEYMDGDLLTVGMDGFIKLWYMDTVEQADPPEDDRFVEVDPQFEFDISSGDERASLMCIIKITPAPENTLWFAQDANGGMWKIDLNVVATPAPPEKIFLCHAGPIADMATAPFGNYIATLGEDGRLFIFDVTLKKMIANKKFQAGGKTLLWLPLKLDKTGSTLIAGFDDGMLRVMTVIIGKEKSTITLIQFSKPHVQPITAMCLNIHGILATGSEDATVFAYQVSVKTAYPSLIPLGFVKVPSSVTYLQWHPKLLTTILVCCYRGEFLEVAMPERPRFDTKISFELKRNESEMKVNSFKSCKSQIRQDLKIKEIEERKAKKLENKRAEMEKLKADNPGIEIDEETFLADSSSEEELEPIYIPEVPNPVLFAIYLKDEILWLSMAGFDAGYIYEYKIDEENPVCCTMVEDADDIEIYTYIYNSTKEYLILAMQNGSLRVNRVNPENHTDLSDYWVYNMHDNSNGKINRMCFSYDESFFFTCGNDGNVFAYKMNIGRTSVTTPYKKTFVPSTKPPEIDDVLGSSIPSLEESKIQEQNRKKMEMINEEKGKVMDIIQSLIPEYQKILERNESLPERQRFTPEELRIDERITNDLNDSIQAEEDLLKRKLAFPLCKSTLALQKVQEHFINNLSSLKTYVMCIRANCRVGTFRDRKISEDFSNVKELVHIKMEEALAKGRRIMAQLEILHTWNEALDVPHAEASLGSVRDSRNTTNSRNMQTSLISCTAASLQGMSLANQQAMKFKNKVRTDKTVPAH